MSTIRVMIVDDHSVVREGLRQFLIHEKDIEVVAEAKTGLDCIELVDKVCPDLIFMGVRMPGICGIETTRLLCQKHPHPRVVMFTIYEDDHSVIGAIQAGAKGYVIKTISRDDLIRAIRIVMQDRVFLDPTITATVIGNLEKSESRRGGEKLTKRELEVLKGMVAGHTDRKIAQSLFISAHTVRSHIKNLYRKLMVSSKTQCIVKAIHDHIIDN